MELIKKSALTRVKNLATKISDDNLTLLSSSISYYSALALAPFLLILLGTASFLGQDLQNEIINRASVTFSPEVGAMVKLVFQNVNQGVNVGSISGIIGVLVLLSTASLVFLQFRYAFDVIYGYYNPNAKKSTMDTIKEKLFSMVVVLFSAILFIVAIGVAQVFEYIMRGEAEKTPWAQLAVFIINFMIYMTMFTGIHYFTPSRRPKLKDAFKISIFSSIFFIIGNILLASYLKGVAADSVYGAAGSLLVFLTWAYYSSFTIFLSVEVFTYLKKIGKIK